MRVSRIRNFSIIAHIDHGKSTLADRLLEITGAVTPREFRDQMLDAMDLERERGITIKATAVQLFYKYQGHRYIINLIDTPGHVDFSYEVSRSLTACEGALLLVDAVQGVEAQTVANAYEAINHNLKIVPVINKMDLPTARPEEVMEEMEQTLGIDPADVILASGKTGTGIEEILAAIIERIPAPSGSEDKPLKALVFDSVFDVYRGVVLYVRLFDGILRAGDKIRMLRAGAEFEVQEVGTFRPKMTPCKELFAGETGYIAANIKDVREVRIGDTVTLAAHAEEVVPLAGYHEPQPMVFCGLYPASDTSYESLREALDRFRLNDSSFSYEPETSEALGFGFRCGFLGLLHMEIVQERLEREEHVELVQTAPTVTYEILKTNGEILHIDNPSALPDEGEISEIREPFVSVSFIIPTSSIGALMKLCEERRGTYKRTEYIGSSRAVMVYELPLAEIVYDFYDKLKSATRGYGTMSYDFLGYHAGNLVKLDMLVNGRRLDALSVIVHREEVDRRGRRLALRLKAEIPRHLFQIPIQAAIGARIVARETIPALGKHVTGKCYGGDITRKRKLWAKQREGKKRLKQFGNVDIPQEAFLAILATED
jgi:GTP-binding protein LepA